MSYLTHNDRGWYIRVETEGAFSFYTIETRNKSHAEKEGIKQFATDFGFSEERCSIGYVWTKEEHENMR